MQQKDTVLDTNLEEHRFSCDQCGADLRFSPGHKMLSCDHCGFSAPIDDQTDFSAAQTGLRELDLKQALNKQLPLAEIETARMVTCPNCAALTEVSATHYSDECPFCATPVVTDTGEHRRIKPKGLVPFELDERQAQKAMNAWLGRLWFAPNGLQEYARKGRKMSGIYVPYWTFDASTKTQYHGQRGTVHTRVRTVMVNGKSQQRTTRHVTWRSVSGRISRLFDDVLILASKGLPKKHTDALEPWDLSRLQPYMPEYLAGLKAEGYTIEVEQGFMDARIYMDRVILRDAKFDIGGDRQRVTQIDTVLNDVTFKHILLPVWLAAYKYRGRSYQFVVNGQNAKVQGARPYSAWKIAFAVVIGLILAVGIGYIVAQNQ